MLLWNDSLFVVLGSDWNGDSVALHNVYFWRGARCTLRLNLDPILPISIRQITNNNWMLHLTEKITLFQMRNNLLNRCQ